MFLQDRTDGGVRIVTSASDLTAASACEFAFLRRMDQKLGRDIRVPEADDPMLARAAGLGDIHEERELVRLREEIGKASSENPGGVTEIVRPENLTEIALLERQRETVAALQARSGVVFQATFFDPAQRPADAVAGAPEIGFVGFADFLTLTASGDYEVQDTKLARRARVTALMQLAAYAEQLDRVGISPAPEATLILGDGSHSRHRLADVSPVFRARRDRLHLLLTERATATGPDGSHETAAPVAWGASGIAACGRCEVCEPEALAARDPLLIAGITRTNRDRLIRAGVSTIEAVANLADDTVEGISAQVLERLRDQARVQVASLPGDAPVVKVSNPAALAALPAPNPGDLFFDFEGDPMYAEPTRSADASSVVWGIDYLFGFVDAEESFTALWAHDHDAERQALLQFLDIVAERRARYPAMKIYHYAAYERTHLLSIAARHGVGEAEVDRLLREHVLVDLYPIVRSALRVGSRSYSIKKLEPLYMGEELRDETGVTDGAQSVTEYAEARQQLDSLDATERRAGQTRLDAIGDYNRYDCVSTLRLRDWLLGIAHAHGVVPFDPADSEAEGDSTGPDLTASSTGEELLTLASRAEQAGDSTEAQALRLAASAIDFHQREQKAFWWAHFARLVDPVEDWADTKDVLVIDPRASVVRETWHVPPRARAARRHLWLRGAVAPGSSLRSGEIYLVYAAPAPFASPGGAPGARAARRARILERQGDGVLVEEMIGNAADPFEALPMAVTPGSPPPAGSQKGAIEEWGRALIARRGIDQPFHDAAFELLRRDAPRLEHGLTPISGNEDGAISAVIESLTRMQRSALAVQGPPGTGKTYLASRVITRLVRERGWQIGVVAQSHRVVENVLSAVVEAGLDPDQVAKVPQGGKLAPDERHPEYTVLAANGHARFLSDHASAGLGCVIGGTAWDLSNERRFERGGLDLLVIDEAGQFSLAPTIAAGVAADRLLLLGDPQQLPQVTQGSHPEPIDQSALGWLIGDASTLSDEHGYFLAETRRMREELTEVVSELSYDGRLFSHPSAGERSVSGAGSAGLTWHPVDHVGNAVSSPEEAAKVVDIVRGALGAAVHTGEQAPNSPARQTRRLTQHDVIVVAPYNAQVECVTEALAAAGLHEVPVGTVDKFQGQEAVLAIVTLAASSAEEVPRGLDFLLMRNRLNVGISRAQWGAHLVSSRRLGAGLPLTVEGLTALSGYLRLLERAVPATVEA